MIFRIEDGEKRKKEGKTNISTIVTVLWTSLNTRFEVVFKWTWRDERKEGQQQNVSGGYLRMLGLQTIYICFFILFFLIFQMHF